MKTTNTKQIAIGKQGDILEIKLRNSNFSVIYSKLVGVQDKKAMKSLIKDLQLKGVDLLEYSKIEERWW